MLSHRTAIDQLNGLGGVFWTLMTTVLFIGCSDVGSTGIGAPSSRPDQLLLVEPSGTESFTCADLGRIVAKELEGLSAEAKGPHGVGIRLQYRPALLRACMVNSQALIVDVIQGSDTDAMDSWLIKVPRMIPGTDSTTSSAFREYLFSSSGAVRDIVLVVGADTVPCGFVHLESTPTIGQYHDVLVGFDVPEDHRQRQMIWTGPDDLMGAAIHFEFREGVFARYHDLVSTIRPN